MTNLKYSLELASEYLNQGDMIERTLNYFGPTTKDKAASC